MSTYNNINMDDVWGDGEFIEKEIIPEEQIKMITKENKDNKDNKDTEDKKIEKTKDNTHKKNIVSDKKKYNKLNIDERYNDDDECECTCFNVGDNCECFCGDCLYY